MRASERVCCARVFNITVSKASPASSKSSFTQCSPHRNIFASHHSPACLGARATTHDLVRSRLSSSCGWCEYLAVIEGFDDVLNHGERRVVLERALGLAARGNGRAFWHLELELSLTLTACPLKLHADPQRRRAAGSTAVCAGRSQGKLRHKGARLEA